MKTEQVHVRRAAHDTGDGWYLHEIDQDGNVIDENGLPWPEDWPNEVSAVFLREKGFVIVPQDFL
jgi:hypothetical protein